MKLKPMLDGSIVQPKRDSFVWVKIRDWFVISVQYGYYEDETHYFITDDFCFYTVTDWTDCNGFFWLPIEQNPYEIEDAK